MSGPSFARLADRAIVVATLLACLSFLSGVFDVALPSLAAGPIAPPPPVEAVERDASLVVSVVSEGATSSPIPHAVVKVFWERDGVYYAAGTARSDASGNVSLDHLPRGVVWVLVEAENRGRSSTKLVLSGERRSVRVGLGPAHELRVHVEEEGGAPIGGATVLVTSSDPLPFGSLTASDGSTLFKRLGPSPWTVKASARGYESVTRSGVMGEVTLSLRHLGSIEVRVEDPDGHPAHGASVVIAGSTLWPARRAETDESGIARIAGLLGGSYDLKATRGDLVSETYIGLVLERGGSEHVTLRLHLGRRVTLLVTDGEGEGARGVPDADVVLVESGLSSFPLRGRTGVDGSVVLGPISPGLATAAARAPDFVPRGGIAVPENPQGPVMIPLRRGATLHGQVVDARDRPIDGASIEVIGTDLDGFPIAETPQLLSFRTTHFEWALPGPLPLIPAGELGVMPGPVPPIPPAFGALAADPNSLALAAPSGMEPGEPVEPWVTAIDGRFTARPVSPGRVRALVRHPAYVEGVSDPVALAPGGEASVKIVLLAGGTLEGRILDELGRPLSGARVDIAATSGTLERTTMTASDGSFAFAAVPAEVVVSVARPEELGTIVLRETISIAEGEKKRVELKLPAPREPVRVVVKDDRGDGVDAAQVTLLSLDPKAPLRRTLFTGRDGVVEVPDARGLGVRLLVEAPGWARVVKSFDAAPEKLEIVLEHGVSVTGRVTAVRGRRYVAGASVLLIADGVRKSALTDAEGMFVVREVTPGQARLVVSHAEYATTTVDVEVKKTGRADRPFEVDDVDLAEPTSVEGDVVDARNNKVSGARVAAGVVPAYLPMGQLPPGMAVTDSNGHFKLSGIAPGTLTIEAYAADLGRGSVKLTVSGGRPTEGVKIRLSERADETEPAASGGVAVTLGERGNGDELEVVVIHVSEASEAERAGLRPGDVIESIDGVRPGSMHVARMRLAGPTGSDVVVGIRREDGRQKLRIGREAVRR